MFLNKVFNKLLVLIFFTLCIGISASQTQNHINNRVNQLGDNESINILIEYASMS